MALTKITELLFSSKHLDKIRRFCTRGALVGDSNLLPLLPFVSYRALVRFFFFLASFPKHDSADVIHSYFAVLHHFPQKY